MTLDELRKAVDDGEIDTVLLALTDMQGRLQGKRFTARHFLDTALADATIAQSQGAQTIEHFLSGNADEIEIQVKNITLDELKAPPYKAAVDFEQVSYSQGGRQERKRETFVAQITFVLRDQIPNAMVLVNPLGLAITYVRVDQAFQ